MPLIVKDQNTPEWHTARLKMITSSTAAGCTGLIPDEAPVTAWKKIMGEAKETTNWYAEYGKRMEEPARNSYEALTGWLVWQTGFWQHPQLKWLGASPDGLVNEGGIEIKCLQKLPTEVCHKHVIQCAVVMAVCELPWIDYFAWLPPKEHFLCRIQRNFVFETALLIQLNAFYAKYVSTGTPPPRRTPVRKKKIETTTTDAAPTSKTLSML